ncbi:hypothetical protein GCK72_023054 [Caenorhabditis remanei]|uniref:NadR/Ttd14 AAA domain-containing protein n=1 Tax=Caenorhabditis remanei TaxID=31234 RepID=A0A6A5FVK5_CAERE|nr:hypothetical protein GCK72_023054 [Caenorhabditis remanei]KAF1746597.1 hypothetical protein GCK72_023054 [Caenorhabditis remanei]
MKKAPMVLVLWGKPEGTVGLALIYKIAVTGGPSAGKTTAMEILEKFFKDHGCEVYLVPEAATELQKMGFSFPKLSADRKYNFQKELINMILYLEGALLRVIGKPEGRDIIIIMDRGVMDPSAYSSPAEWSAILKDLGLNEFELKHTRYDHVVHMVTAAEGAPNAYTLETNAVRVETPEQARDIDHKTRQAWIGHQYFDIVDNSGTANIHDKVNKVIQVICDRMGIPGQVAVPSNKRKWLIEEVDWKNFGVFEEFHTKHLYLVSHEPQVQERIRRRSKAGQSTYTLTRREYNKDCSGYSEKRTNCSEAEYNHSLKMKDRKRSSIYKRRRCFVYETMSFNLDIYCTPLPPRAHGVPYLVLEAFTNIPKGTPLPAGSVPPFLRIAKEITDNSEYSMFRLAEYSS